MVSPLEISSGTLALDVQAFSSCERLALEKGLHRKRGLGSRKETSTEDRGLEEGAQR